MVVGRDIVQTGISVGRNNALYHCPSPGITQDPRYQPVEQLALAVRDHVET